nr:iron-sulfur cluster assembly scaffold protein [Halostella salina]
MAEHYRQPHNCTMDDEPTFLISYQEMTCGDQAQFAVRVTESGRIEKLSFETESCAVSQAVASILATYLEGQQLENVAERDDIIGDLIDGQFPELRHDCVVGPEEVIKEGIRAKLDQATDPTGLE